MRDLVNKMHRPVNINKLSPTFLQLLVFGVLVTMDSSLMAANKFETIGGGVAGSTSIKLMYLRPISIGFGLFFLACSLLSLTPLGHKNALTMNHTRWKLSSGIFFLLSVISFGFAIFA